MCVCARAAAGVCVHARQHMRDIYICACAAAGACVLALQQVHVEAEDHSHELVFSFYHGGPRDHNQALSVLLVGAPLWGAILLTHHLW